MKSQHLLRVDTNVRNDKDKLLSPGLSPRTSKDLLSSVGGRIKTFEKMRAQGKLTNMQVAKEDSTSYISYIAVLQGADSISLHDTMLKPPKDTDDVEYKVEYHLTFWEQKNKHYFGRTFKTPELKLVESFKKDKMGGKLYRCETPAYVYYHSSLKENGQVKVLAEIVVIQLTKQGREKTYSSTGYAIFDPF